VIGQLTSILALNMTDPLLGRHGLSPLAESYLQTPSRTLFYLFGHFLFPPTSLFLFPSYNGLKHFPLKIHKESQNISMLPKLDLIPSPKFLAPQGVFPMIESRHLASHGHISTTRAHYLRCLRISIS